MPDAEVIQLGSRGRAGRGSRSTPSAAARGLADESPRQTTGRPPRIAPDPEPEAADVPPGQAEDDHESQPAVDLAALLAEVAGGLAALVQQLRGVEFDALRQVAADPLGELFRLLDRMGFDLGEPAEQLAEFARSRFRGDYAVDEFGFDPEFTERVFLPLLRPLVHTWFRVDVRGAENLPETGSALLVSNHAGTLPLDGMVLHAVVHEEIGRHVRMLGADLIFATPYSHDLARKTGTTLACPEDTERLLANDQLVAVFPEGFKGLGKLYADRYKLQRFGRGGFVSTAVRAQVPIVPVSIVGSEEIYPLLSRAPSLARALGVPYFPITPLFPWLGLLGMVPLPSKWVISFGEAIATDELPPGAAEDPMVVFNVTDQVRETIQQTLYAQLVQRGGAFR